MAKVVAEVGSGLNGHRKSLIAVLRSPEYGVIIVEHRDRLARFGSEYIEAALAASGRRLVVVEPDEVRDDLVQDMIDVLTSFCARLSGRRSARRRAERALASHVGARRFAFNWGLALVKERLDARARGEDVEVPWTLPALRREWNRAKEAMAPWWRENSKEAYSSGLAGLAAALQNWSASRHGQRKGRRMGFPRFRKKGRSRESVSFTTGAIRVDDQSHVVLPRIGRVRTHEHTTALLARVEAGTARILRATVSREGGRWFVSFTCEVEREPKTPRCSDAVVGVDAGLRHLAVLSTGERVPNPRPLKRALRKLARRAPGSHNREETRRRLARLHARIARIRRDTLHKLTTQLARTYGTVVVERLHVAGMLRNRRLARSVADASLAEMRRQLVYKTVWYGSQLVEAERFYPSSRMCSQCGAVKDRLPLSERTFQCDACGLVLDRDENAARNLAALVGAVAGSGPET